MVNEIPDGGCSIDIGVSFSNLGSVDGKYTISVADKKVFNTEIHDGDVLLIFNPNAYNYDWYEYKEKYVDGPRWAIQDMETYESIYVESFEVKDGDNIVFMPMNGNTDFAIGISGQVADLKGASRRFVVDLNSADANDYMFPISNPYPIDTTKKMFEGFIADADVILVWNDLAYNYDWYEYKEKYAAGPAWAVQDMETYETTYILDDDAVILPAGHGGVFYPMVKDGVRTWEVSLEK